VIVPEIHWVCQLLFTQATTSICRYKKAGHSEQPDVGYQNQSFAVPPCLWHVMMLYVGNELQRLYGQSVPQMCMPVEPGKGESGCMAMSLLAWIVSYNLLSRSNEHATAYLAVVLPVAEPAHPVAALDVAAWVEGVWG
jgi:hypothetical protein